MKGACRRPPPLQENPQAQAGPRARVVADRRHPWQSGAVRRCAFAPDDAGAVAASSRTGFVSVNLGSSLKLIAPNKPAAAMTIAPSTMPAYTRCETLAGCSGDSDISAERRWSAAGARRKLRPSRSGVEERNSSCSGTSSGTSKIAAAPEGQNRVCASLPRAASESDDLGVRGRRIEEVGANTVLGSARCAPFSDAVVLRRILRDFFASFLRDASVTDLVTSFLDRCEGTRARNEWRCRSDSEGDYVAGIGEGKRV